MEVKQDKIEVEIVDGNVEVTRTIIEKFTPTEYLQNILKMELSVSSLEGQTKETVDLLTNYRQVEKEAATLEKEQKNEDSK